MSFSSDIKEELSRVNINNNKCCILAELAGFLITNCNIVKENNEFVLKISTENAAAIRRVYKFFKIIYDITPITNIEKEKTFKDNLYQLKIVDKNDLEKLFKDTLINIDVNLQIILEEKENIKKQECCTKSFLRGLFIGGGSMSNPNNMYHLEIVFTSIENSAFVNNLIHDIGIKSGIIKRKKNFVIYIKDSEDISRFLAYIGSNKGTIVLEETRTVKEFRNNLNRISNFENANYDKTIDAALSQIEDIMTIKKNKKFSSLSKALREIANLRLEYRMESLEELGNKIEPKLSRSGVKHRFRRIKEIADEIRSSIK